MFDKKPEIEKQLFEEACEYHNIPLFSVEEGKNDSEKEFLNNMSHKMIYQEKLTFKEFNYLRNIIDPNFNEPATPRQIKCIKGSGRTVRDGLTKIEASRMLTELKGNSNKPATQRQINYIEYLGGTVRNDLTIAEASEMITELKGN